MASVFGNNWLFPSSPIQGELGDLNYTDPCSESFAVILHSRIGGLGSGVLMVWECDLCRTEAKRHHNHCQQNTTIIIYQQNSRIALVPSIH